MHGHGHGHGDAPSAPPEPYAIRLEHTDEDTVALLDQIGAAQRQLAEQRMLLGQAARRIRELEARVQEGLQLQVQAPACPDRQTEARP